MSTTCACGAGRTGSGCVAPTPMPGHVDTFAQGQLWAALPALSACSACASPGLHGHIDCTGPGLHAHSDCASPSLHGYIGCAHHGKTVHPWCSASRSGASTSAAPPTPPPNPGWQLQQRAPLVLAGDCCRSGCTALGSKWALLRVCSRAVGMRRVGGGPSNVAATPPSRVAGGCDV
jgi:hypothetical protein